MLTDTYCVSCNVFVSFSFSYAAFEASYYCRMDIGLD